MKEKMQDSTIRRRVLITALMIISASVMLFPTIANWFSTLKYQESHGSYAESTANMDPAEVERILDRARQYNDALPWGPLRDPYVLNERGEVEDMRDGLPEYESQLDFGEGAPLGWAHVPSISANLPVYHGTSDAVLDKGAGHLHGSALPVGGDSSHSVITAHSGRANSRLFSDLGKVKLGDVFYVEVLGQKFYYEVVETVVVKPDEGDYLRRIEGHDYVTLITCTPTGVNTHRLLVKGERIPAPAEAETTFDAEKFWPGFPWWAVILLGVGAGTWTLLKVADDRAARKAGGDSSADGAPKKVATGPRHAR